MLKLGVRIETEGLNQKEIEKVELAKKHVIGALNSPEFEKFVLTYHYKTKVNIGIYKSILVIKTARVIGLFFSNSAMILEASYCPLS